MDDTSFWVALSHIPTIGPQRFKRLYQSFSSAQAIWEAPLSALTAVVSHKTATCIDDARKKIDREQIAVHLKKHNVTIICNRDSNYPVLLHETHSAPFLLYAKGNTSLLQNPTLAIVGTRKMTAYGKQVLDLLIEPLVHAGITIVSGLAYGVDAYAHQQTLHYGGNTIAVLGSAITQTYPSAHRALAENICTKNGLLISEYPHGYPALKANFPRRNRIISGISQAVLVIEAPEKSGALITAYGALEQNREVFAVPGSILYPMSRGTNALLARGARMVCSPKDIVDFFESKIARPPMIPKQQTLRTQLSERENTLMELLKTQNQLHTVLAHSTIPPHETLQILTQLEIKGIITNDRGTLSIQQL